MHSSSIPKSDQLLQALASRVHQHVSIRHAEKVNADYQAGLREFECAELQLAYEDIMQPLTELIYDAESLHDFMAGAFFSELPEYQIVFDYIKSLVFAYFCHHIKTENELGKLKDDLNACDYAFMDNVNQYLLPVHVKFQSGQELFLDGLKQQFLQNKSVFSSYDHARIMLEIFKRNFAYGQIPLLDENLYPYLKENKTLVLSGQRMKLSSDIAKLISFQEFKSGYPGHSSYADGDRYYYKQMLHLIPAIACQYAIDIRTQLEDAAEKDSLIVSAWIRQSGSLLADFTNFPSILDLLTILHQQDALRLQVCRGLEITPESGWCLTLPLARVFCSAVTDELKLAAVVALLPESAHEGFSKAVRGCWPGFIDNAVLRRRLSMFSIQRAPANEDCHAVYSPIVKRT